MFQRNKYLHFLESNILLKKSLMASNVNLDYSSEITNFNIKKKNKALLLSQ